MNSKFRSFWLPIVLIRVHPLTPDPDCRMIGVSQVKEQSCLALLNRSRPSKPSVRTKHNSSL